MNDAAIPEFAELHCLTNYSFLRAASHPEEMVQQAILEGYAGLAITDECSIVGVVKAWKALQKYHHENLLPEADFKLVTGAEFFYQEHCFVVLANSREAYGERCRLITRCQQRADKGKYDQPSSEWPTIPFNWDLSKEGQRYSLDGMNKDDFIENHPQGFLPGYVKLKEFDTKPSKFSCRDEGELWQVRSKDRLAYLIVYLSENHKISPPLCKPLEDGEVILTGGNHRYAIAKEIGIDRMPIYVQPEHKTDIDSILNVEWENS